MYAVKSRSKRDSVPNLYAKCQISGNCLPDVQNKVEANTLADRLLKWLGSVIYLGGLGIGTGKGSGGSTGYNPLATPSRVSPSGTVIRPTVPLDGIGPTDVTTVDVIDPTGPSLIPLTDITTPEITIIDSAGGGIDLAPDEQVPELEILTTPDPVSDVTGASSHPTVIGTENDTVAVLDVTPQEPPTKRIALGTQSRSSTPHISVITGSTDIGPVSDINVFVDNTFSGEFIGGTDIPLQDLNPVYQFEIELPPKTSTPRDIIQNITRRARQLYNRRVQQVATRNPEFLTRPSRAIVFENPAFENPAFESKNITLTFQQDLADVAAAAPDPDFADVIKLHRPQLSETEEGLIRFSRLGQRGTIRTRSGVQIGQAVHFYYDLSTIDTADAIELSPLGQQTGDLSIVDAMAESSFIDVFQNPDTTLTDEQQLLDDLTEDFENAHLILTGSSRRTTFSLPTIPPGIGLRIFVDDVGNDFFVSYPETRIISGSSIPNQPFGPLVPPILLDVYSNDYYLHPGHFKRRKRKRSEMF